MNRSVLRMIKSIISAVTFSTVVFFATSGEVRAQECFLSEQNTVVRMAEKTTESRKEKNTGDEPVNSIEGKNTTSSLSEKNNGNGYAAAFWILAGCAAASQITYIKKKKKTK